MQFPKTASMREIADAIAPIFDNNPGIVAVDVAIEGRRDLSMKRDGVAMWRTGGIMDQRGVSL